MSVCVIHLVWAPLGPEPLRRFVASYRANPGGVGHRLLVVYNGFGFGDGRAAYLRETADLAHEELVLPQPMQDIPAYFAAAESAAEARVCFLNSYSQPLDPAWLRKLSAGLDQPGMGAVGASGSAESLFTHFRTHWRSARTGLPGRVQRVAASLHWRRHFATFPNHHLRTNAFLIGRERFLRLRRPILDKSAAERFESGRHSLTACLRAQNLQVGVVGRDGLCYPPARWPESRTYRLGAQENLLVADNRTLQYEQADAAGRSVLTRAAWGLPAA